MKIGHHGGQQGPDHHLGRQKNRPPVFFGIGDAYPVSDVKHTDEVKKTGWLKGDMMRENGPVSPNDIEMLLEAFKTGRRQNFKGENKSEVIRLP